jgi:hypothetical protein
MSPPSLGCKIKQSNRQARGRKKAMLVSTNILLGKFFDSESGGDRFFRNVGYILNGKHSVIFHKTEVFITTAVRTSNPTV